MLTETVFAFRRAARRRFAGRSSIPGGPVAVPSLQSHPKIAPNKATWAKPGEAAGWEIPPSARTETREMCKPRRRSKVLLWQPGPEPISQINRPPGIQTWAFGRKKAELPAAPKPIAADVRA